MHQSALHTALKEVNETRYRLSLLNRTNIIVPAAHHRLENFCREIRITLIVLSIQLKEILI